MNELEAAIKACEQGRLDEARQKCEMIVSCDQTDAAARHLLGVVCGMAGDHAQAADNIAIAVQLAGDRIDFRRNLCRAYLQLGKLQLAEHSLREGLELSPTAGPLWEMLGMVLAQQQQFESAIEAYRQAISLAPQVSSLHFGLSELHRMRGENASALAALREAIRLEPDNVHALNNLAGLELHAGDFLPALRTIKRLLELAPKSAQAYFNLARMLEVAGDLPQAIAALRNALIYDPQLTRAKFLIASLQIQIGELDEAELLVRELFDSMGSESAPCLTALAKIQERKGCIDDAQRTLEKIPEEYALHPEVATTRAVVAEQQGRFQEAIDGLQAVLAEDHYAASEGIGIYFMLGQLYDTQADYDAAFEAYRMGNENRRKAFISVDGEVSFGASAYDQLSQLFSREMYDACPESALETDVPVFIVGMPRSGTTLVEQILDSHSDVYGAGELSLVQDAISASYPIQPRRSPLEIIPADRFNGEHCIVPYGWGHNKPEDITRIAQHYYGEVNAMSPTAKRVTDKLPYNFFLLPIIHRLFPQAKIIHCQRNSLDTCLSCYFQNFTTGNRFSFELEDLGRFYVDYCRLMQLWTENLGIPVMNVRYENLATDPEPVARELLDYCGLSWDPSCLDFHRSSRTVHTASYQQVRKPLYTTSIGRAKHYSHRLGPLIEVVKSVDPDCDKW